MLRFARRSEEPLPVIQVAAYVAGQVHFHFSGTLPMGDQDFVTQTGSGPLQLKIRVEEYFSDRAYFTGILLGPEEAFERLEAAFPRSRAGQSRADRRRAPRVDRIFAVQLLEPKQPAVVIDLSCLGLRLGCSEALQPGTPVKTRLEVGEITIEVAGTVRWCQRHESGNFMVGVELAGMSPQLRGIYRRLVEGDTSEPEWSCADFSASCYDGSSCDTASSDGYDTRADDDDPGPSSSSFYYDY